MTNSLPQHLHEPQRHARLGRKRLAVCFVLMLPLLTACTTTTRHDAQFAPEADVQITMDSNGIPHISATNDGDLLYGQGYVTAEMRPAQSEIFRLRSQGRGAEIYGEDELGSDILIRSLNLIGFAKSHWQKLASDWPDTALAYKAYAAGFNRKYREYRQHGWPSTLQVLIDAGFAPKDWTGSDVYAVSLLIGLGLSGAPSVEIIATLAKVFLGSKLFADLFRFAAPTTAAVVPGFGQRQPRFPLAPASGQTGLGQAAPWQALGNLPLQSWREAVSRAKSLDRIRLGGSNAFAVDPAHSSTGYTIVESDTHEGVPAPGTYMLVHLSSTRLPGATGSIDAIGASFPGTPLVIFGHNQKTAWSATIGYTDIVDFYWEKSDPDDRSRVLRPGGKSLPTTSRSESFRIRRDDGSYRSIHTEVRDIPGFGPILPAEFLPIPLPFRMSVRWTGLGLPSATEAILGMNRANNVGEHFAAMRHLRGASAGFILGDSHNIGYSLWNLHPIRDASGPFKPWMVIPADVGPHWQGYLPFEQMPWDYNPPKGYLWTANTDPDGDTFDNMPGNEGIYYGFGYMSGYRGDRLRKELARLAAAGKISPADLETLQRDRYSGFAAQLRPHLLAAAARSPGLLTDDLRPYYNAVSGWNLEAAPESTAATIFYTWAHHLVVDLLFDDFELLDELGEESMQMVGRTLIYWLDKTAPDISAINAGTKAFPSLSGINLFDNRSTKDHIETLDEQIFLSLREAVLQLKKAFATPVSEADDAVANDTQSWHWRNINQLRLRHTLSALDKSWERYDQTWGFGGNFGTVNVGGYTVYKADKWQNRFYITNAPSNRFMTEFDADGVSTSRFMLPSGQSEIPGDPHYNDLVDDYVHNRYRLMPYTDAQIEAATERSYTIR